MRLIGVAVGRNVAEEFNLVDGLVEVVLIIFDNFYTKIRILL